MSDIFESKNGKNSIKDITNPGVKYKIMVFDNNGKSYRLFSNKFFIGSGELVVYDKGCSTTFHFVLENITSYSIKNLIFKKDEETVNKSEEI